MRADEFTRGENGPTGAATASSLHWLLELVCSTGHRRVGRPNTPPPPCEQKKLNPRRGRPRPVRYLLYLPEASRSYLSLVKRTLARTAESRPRDKVCRCPDPPSPLGNFASQKQLETNFLPPHSMSPPRLQARCTSLRLLVPQVLHRMVCGAL